MVEEMRMAETPASGTSRRIAEPAAAVAVDIHSLRDDSQEMIKSSPPSQTPQAPSIGTADASEL